MWTFETEPDKTYSTTSVEPRLTHEQTCLDTPSISEHSKAFLLCLCPVCLWSCWCWWCLKRGLLYSLDWVDQFSHSDTCIHWCPKAHTEWILCCHYYDISSIWNGAYIASDKFCVWTWSAYIATWFWHGACVVCFHVSFLFFLCIVLHKFYPCIEQAKNRLCQ